MNSKNLLAELEHELVSTGKLLQLVPIEKLNWQPHPRAMTLGELALHVASIPGRYCNFAVEGSTTLETLLTHPAPKNKSEILDAFAESTIKAKNIIGDADEAWMNKSWDLTKNGKSVFSLPRALFVRLLVFNHLFHHRGQLSAYLRTLSVRIPSIYGPSGDENPFE